VSPRAGARAALALGLGASLAGNALAAQPTLLGRVVAAWAPLALAVVAWLVEHYKPAPGPWRFATWFGTGIVAAVAAWVSYWHLVHLALKAGETGAAAYLLPLSVDGLILVATAYLRQPAETVDSGPVVAEPEPLASPPVRVETPAVMGATARPDPTPVPAPARRVEVPTVADDDTDTGATVRRLAADHPDWTRRQIAEAAGCSERTVRRHLNTDTDPDPEPEAVLVLNGHHRGDLP
jgi:hypothetical protein